MRKYIVLAPLAAVMLVSVISGCSKTEKATVSDRSCPANNSVCAVQKGPNAPEVSTDKKQNKKFFEAVMKNDLATLKAMLKQNKGFLNIRNVKVATPLHVATKVGNLEVVKLLVDAGADVNAVNKQQRTPLHAAATHKRVEIARYLVDHGANLDARSDILSVPMHDAVVNNSLEIVKILVEKGANMNAKSKRGMTPLTVAMMRNRTDIVNYLKSKGAEYDKMAASDKTRSKVVNEAFCCEKL